MAYDKQTWIDDVTPVTAEKMNHIEEGIVEASKTGGVEVGTIVRKHKNETTSQGWEDVIDENEVTKINVSDLITLATGFTASYSNVFKQGNRYFGNLNIQNTSGKFSSTASTIGTLNKTLNGVYNLPCDLGTSQWAINGNGRAYFGDGALKITDDTNSSKYNCAFLQFEIITTETSSTKPIKKVAVTPLPEPATASIINSTNIENKEENTYSANIIDNLVKTVTNDNGNAIKYPDGTMICIKRVILTNVNVTQAVGQDFMSDVIDLGSWAENFVGTPIENITLIGGNMCYVSPASWYSNKNCGGIRLVRPTSATVAEVHINIVAYGRWKE